jgi:hypothetical protein
MFSEWPNTIKEGQDIEAFCCCREQQPVLSAHAGMILNLLGERDRPAFGRGTG